MDYIPGDQVTIHKTYLNSRRKSNIARFIWTSSEHFKVLSLQYIQTHAHTCARMFRKVTWEAEETKSPSFPGAIICYHWDLSGHYQNSSPYWQATNWPWDWGRGAPSHKRENGQRWWCTGLRERPPSLAGSLLHTRSRQLRTPTGAHRADLWDLFSTPNLSVNSTLTTVNPRSYLR